MEQWSRSRDTVDPHQRRWRVIWAGFGLGSVLIATIAGIGYGAGGVIAVAILAIVGALVVGSAAMASRGDARAEVSWQGDDLVIDGPIPDRVPAAELSGFRVVERVQSGSSPKEPGMRSKSWERPLTLIELERNGGNERHLLLSGYLPASDAELAELRSLLARRVPELPSVEPAG